MRVRVKGDANDRGKVLYRFANVSSGDWQDANEGKHISLVVFPASEQTEYIRNARAGDLLELTGHWDENNARNFIVARAYPADLTPQEVADRVEEILWGVEDALAEIRDLLARGNEDE